MYDSACEVLARHFLSDLAEPALIKELAQHIQDEIENWIEDRTVPPAPPSSKQEG